METKFCHSCGKSIPDSSSFCTNCGAKQHLGSSENVKKYDAFQPAENIAEKHTDFKKPFF